MKYLLEKLYSHRALLQNLWYSQSLMFKDLLVLLLFLLFLHWYSWDFLAYIFNNFPTLNFLIFEQDKKAKPQINFK